MNNQNINPKSLKGKDLFNRTLELMDKLTPINESVINASLEFVKRAPNGLVYTIIRENHKYFIKTTNNTRFKLSNLEYIGGLKNKMSEAYPSYEEALKHLNMKFQELNEMYGIKHGYNLFEQDVFEVEDATNEETGVKEKKYKLKVDKGSEGEETAMPTPSAEMPEAPIETPKIEDVSASPEGEGLPGGEGAPEAEGLPGGEDTPEGLPGGEEAPEGEEFPSGEETPEGEEDEDDIDIDEEEDPKKYIQKLTGRLGQKIRELSEVDPKLEKYVINSIISALHIDKMDKKDRMDVIRKFKKKKGMESIMKESFNMDEYYGMTKLNRPFNFEKLRSGFDEDHVMDHPKKHRPLKFKKFELDMDEELHGNQDKLDLNRNGRLDSEDFKMLRSGKNKKSSDEQWQAIVGSALGSYMANRNNSDENLESDREKRIKDAIRRIKAKRSNSDDIRFHSSKDEIHDLEFDHKFKGGGNEPDVADPEIEVDEPLTPPVPDFPDPWNPTKPSVMPHPKAKKKNDDDEFDLMKK